MESRRRRAVEGMAHKENSHFHIIWTVCGVSPILVGDSVNHSLTHHRSSFAIIFAFTIPRVPTFEFNNETPLTLASGSFNNSISAQFSRAPANFTFPAFAALQIDTSGNFIPLT